MNLRQVRRQARTRLRKRTGRAGIDRLGHREYVGGRWEEMGRLQFDYLLDQGVEPTDAVVDVACGSLRLGRLLIPYLDPGHYLGIEMEAELIEKGCGEEVDQAVLAEKRPQFVVSGAFEFDRFTMAPTVGMAQSIFTHLVATDIDLCMTNLAAATTSCRLFATFFEGAGGQLGGSHAHIGFRYSREEMLGFGERNGWAATYVGDWGHPKGQVMVRYDR